jgi:hypothetical protein
MQQNLGTNQVHENRFTGLNGEHSFDKTWSQVLILCEVTLQCMRRAVSLWLYKEKNKLPD